MLADGVFGGVFLAVGSGHVGVGDGLGEGVAYGDAGELGGQEACVVGAQQLAGVVGFLLFAAWGAVLASGEGVGGVDVGEVEVLCVGVDLNGEQVLLDEGIAEYADFACDVEWGVVGQGGSPVSA